MAAAATTLSILALTMLSIQEASADKTSRELFI
jgi:hypothetical protein